MFHWSDSGNHDIIVPPSHLSFQTERSYLEWAQCIPRHFAPCPVFLSLSLYSVKRPTRACYGYPRTFEKTTGSQEPYTGTQEKLLDLWNICHGTVARELHNDTKH